MKVITPQMEQAFNKQLDELLDKATEQVQTALKDRELEPDQRVNKAKTVLKALVKKYSTLAESTFGRPDFTRRTAKTVVRTSVPLEEVVKPVSAPLPSNPSTRLGRAKETSGRVRKTIPTGATS